MRCDRLIEVEKAHHGVSRLARVLGVARAGYYAWTTRPRSGRAVADARLVEQIREIHTPSRGTDGAPPIQAELRLGWTSGSAASGWPGSCAPAGSSASTVADGTPDRDTGPGSGRTPGQSTSSDRLWVADITQQRTGEGWRYLAVVLDAFSRRIVGWSMADHLRTELVLDALDWPAPNPTPPQAWCITPTTAAKTPA